MIDDGKSCSQNRFFLINLSYHLGNVDLDNYDDDQFDEDEA